jgi:anti-sigma-K factor RskA
MGMEQSAINETLVRQYLLGLLSEDEHERLEMSLLTDDRIYETLTALEDEVEDELIDQYLAAVDPEPQRRRRGREGLPARADARRRRRGVGAGGGARLARHSAARYDER